MVSKSIAMFTITLFFIIFQARGVRRDLNQLNQPPIKTITSKYGDIFDCVDIHKQPSLDHPLLQNHTLQMKPSLIPETSSSPPNGSTPHDNCLRFEIEDGGCPEGFVPIRRVRDQDIQRSGAYFKEYESPMNPNSNKPGWHYAAARTLRSQSPAQAGRGGLNVWNPTVSGQQHSHSSVSVSSGMVDAYNTIHAGWAVNPGVYGDNHVRFHTIWTADNYQKTGCIDMRCHGFVQVSRTFALGMVINPVSQYGGPQFQMPIAISHDQLSGNWWLIASKNIMVGYWPADIFTTLKDHAEIVGWGGAVYSPVGTPSPQMGSGHMPSEGFGKACWIQEMQFMRSNQGVYEDLKADLLVLDDDIPRCYGVKLYMDSQLRANMMFGGPGGRCG